LSSKIDGVIDMLERITTANPKSNVSFASPNKYRPDTDISGQRVSPQENEQKSTSRELMTARVLPRLDYNSVRHYALASLTPSMSSSRQSASRYLLYSKRLHTTTTESSFKDQDSLY